MVLYFGGRPPLSLLPWNNWGHMRRISNHSCKKSLLSANPHGGAVLVETAMTLFIFISFIAAIFMMGILSFRYALLIDVTSNALRAVSVDASAGFSNCHNLNTAVQNAAINYLRDTYGVNSAGAGITFTGRVSRFSHGVSAGCSAQIELSSAWPINCFFCPMFKAAGAMSVTQSREVEDVLFRKCGGCDTC